MSSQCPCYECDYVRRGYGPPYYPCARTGEIPAIGRDARQTDRAPTGYTPRFRGYPPTGFTPRTPEPFDQTGYASMAGHGGTGMTPRFVGAFGGTGLTPRVVYGTGMGPGLWGGLGPTGLTPSLRPPFFPPTGFTPGVPYGHPSMYGTGTTPRTGNDDRDYHGRQEIFDSLGRESEAYNRRYREEREQRTPRPGPNADRRAGGRTERPSFGAEAREPSTFHSDSIRSGRTPQVPTPKPKVDTSGFKGKRSPHPKPSPLPKSFLGTPSASNGKKATPRASGLRHSESAYDDEAVVAGPSKPTVRVYDEEELDILRQERRDLTAENFDLHRRLRETEDMLAQSRMQEQWLRDDLTEEMLAREFALLHDEDVPVKSITGVASTETEGPKSAMAGNAATEQTVSALVGKPATTADAETQTVVEDAGSPDTSKTKNNEAPK
ncbi:hypothetical protein LTR95_003742 [Oleoguttula sp. CCFEE 5521]